MVGLAIGLVLAIAPIVLPPGETLWHRIAAPDEDGRWQFRTIDGVDVSEGGYSVYVRWSEIAAFHDGCKSCGFTGENYPGTRRRMLTCDAIECNPQPMDAAIARFVHGAPTMGVRGDHLILILPGHRAELVRKPRP